MRLTTLLIFACGALGALVLTGCGGGGDASGTAAATADAATGLAVGGNPSPRTVGLDPTPFRRQIQAVEQLVYSHREPDWDTASKVGRAVTEVGSAVMASSQDPWVRQKGHALVLLGGQIDARGDVGYGRVDLPAVRRQWEDTRNGLFQSAGWFQGNLPDRVRGGQGARTAALDRAQTPEANPALPFHVVRNVRRVLEQTERLCDRAQPEYSRLGEPDYEGRGGPRATAVARRWAEWGREWEEERIDVWDDMPDWPAAGGDDLRMIWHELERAHSVLATVGVGVGQYATPTEHAWNQRFEAARVHLRLASERLARLEVAD